MTETWHPVAGLLRRRGRAAEGADATVQVFTPPVGSPVSSVYTVTVNGAETCCYTTSEGHYAKCAVGPGLVTVTIESAVHIDAATVHPKRHSISPVIAADRDSVTFTITRAGAYTLVINDDWTRPCYLFANPIDPAPPAPGDVTYYYGPGYYDHTRPDGVTPLNVNGALVLSGGQSCFLHGGAFLHGKIHVGTDQANVGPVNAPVAVKGHGAVDSTQTSTGNGPGRPMLIGNMQAATIKGITLVGVTHWGCPVFESTDVLFDHVQMISLEAAPSDTPDGFDVVGSRRVTWDGCFIRAVDDALAIKTFKQGFGPSPYWRGNVEDILVTDTVIHQGDGGNGLEIGYENLDNNSSSAPVNDPVTGVLVNHISGITYRDVDIIRKERDPAIIYRMAGLGIHLIDGVPLSNVLYERVNVEYCDGQFWLWFGAFASSDYSYGDERAPIAGVTLRDVTFDGPGELPIHLQGGGGGVMISDVVFDNVRVKGVRLNSTSIIPGVVSWEVTNTDPITFP